MLKLMARVVLGVWLAHSGLSTSPVSITDAPLTLSRVDIIGTTRLSSDDVAAGLNLKVGKQVTRDELTRACAHFDQLKLFYSARCEYRIGKANASLSIFVNEASHGLPVVFDNFVWANEGRIVSTAKARNPSFHA